MILVLEDGDILYYKRISKGTSYDDAVYMHTETSTRFYKSLIFWNGDGWTLKLKDGAQILFPEAYNARNSAQGAPYESIDDAGNKLLLQRDGQRNLQELQTSHGHWIQFTYDGNARIREARDDRANAVQYSYNKDGMLSDAISTTGKDRHYDYDNELMTKVTDGQGRTLVRNFYWSRILVGQQYSNGDLYKYSYTWSSDDKYIVSALVTLPNHSQQLISVADYLPDLLRANPSQ